MPSIAQEIARAVQLILDRGRAEAKSLITPVANVRGYGAKGDGETDDTAAIQAALDSGAKSVYIPAGTYLVDDVIYVPDGVTLYGEGPTSIIRAIGHDTHGRNNKIFDKCNGTGLTTAVIVIRGSNAVVRDLVVDGNGLNNYYTVGGKKIYQNGSSYDPDWRLGYSGIRVGLDAYGTDPANRHLQRNIRVVNVITRYCSWGGILINGESMRLVQGYVFPDEDKLGVQDVQVVGCTIEYCGSNNLAVIGAKNFTIADNHVISAVHSGIKLYRNWAQGLVSGNQIVFDEDRFISWEDGKTEDEHREGQFSSRSESLAVGHGSNTGVARDAVIHGNFIDGKGKIHRGITCYSPSHNITITGNTVKGVVRAFMFGPVGTVKISGNSFSAVNYQYTAVNPGTYLAAQCVAQNTDTNDLQGAYTETNLSFTGNDFGGRVLNLIRLNTWGSWDTLNIKANLSFAGNTFDLSQLEDWGGNMKKGVQQLSMASAGGVIVYRGNTYVDATGSVDDFDAVFTVNASLPVYTDLLWMRTLTLGTGISPGSDGTPRLLYNDNTGVVTLMGSIASGYSVGTTTPVATIPTRFRPLNNMNVVVDNGSAVGTKRSAIIRITQAGSIYVIAADSTAHMISLQGVSWPTRY